MSLTTEQIELIRSSWARVVPISAMASQLFYARLFKIAPETEPLFRSDLEEQGRKLMESLTFIVDHLDQIDELTKAAEALALRHLKYGVTADQYAPVGEALVWTMGHLLGPAFRAQQREAWLVAYALLSNHMITCAYSEAPRSASSA